MAFFNPSTLSNILKKFIFNQIIFYSSTEDILTPQQYGFCPASTTTDCVLDLLEETTTTLDKGDMDKKLIAFVASVMLIALLKQIQSGVPAGFLSS